jgi:hypothetical protein
VHKAVSDKDLIAIPEAVIEARRKLVFVRRKGKQPAIRFKLIDDVRIQGSLGCANKGIGTRIGIHGQDAVESESAFGGGEDERVLQWI